MNKTMIGSSALVALVTLSSAAFAETTATATTALNMRAGPGPHHAVVGTIDANASVTVLGCIDNSKWCEVSANGKQAWAYSEYLVADISGTAVVVSEKRADIGVPTVIYKDQGGIGGATAGGAAGAITGALIAGPVGAVIGGVAGATVGGAADASTPSEPVIAYVRSNQVEPVYLDGEVVVGAGIPETVTLYQVPDAQYSYVYVNGQPVLVEPQSRKIVYVVR